jgi:hypothetical protein
MARRANRSRGRKKNLKVNLKEVEKRATAIWSVQKRAGFLSSTHKLTPQHSKKKCTN